MLINISNLSYNNWSENQKDLAVEEYGWVEDLLLPKNKLDTDEINVTKLAENYLAECKFMFEMANIPVSQQAYNEAVLVIGETPLINELIQLLTKEGIKCLTCFSEFIN